MKEGEDYNYVFAPVQHATAVRAIILIAAALDLELHSCNLAQAFVQADKLNKGVNGRIFVCPPQGSEEEKDVVY
eukprot:2726996-Rhodomonas_salina.1